LTFTLRCVREAGRKTDPANICLHRGNGLTRDRKAQKHMETRVFSRRAGVFFRTYPRCCPYIGSLLELYWKPIGTLLEADRYSTASRPLPNRWLMATRPLADGYSIAGRGLAAGCVVAVRTPREMLLSTTEPAAHPFAPAGYIPAARRASMNSATPSSLWPGVFVRWSRRIAGRGPTKKGKTVARRARHLPQARRAQRSDPTAGRILQLR
jgi:hypothetical protein